jgi:hypothetical protein
LVSRASRRPVPGGRYPVSTVVVDLSALATAGGGGPSPVHVATCSKRATPAVAVGWILPSSRHRPCQEVRLIFSALRDGSPPPVSSGRECPGWRGIETSTTVSPTAAPEARPLCQPAGGGFVTTITHVDRLAGGRSDRAGTYAILLFRFVGARSTLRPLGRPRGGAQPEANEGKRTCRDSYERAGVDAPSRWRSWLLRWRR